MIDERRHAALTLAGITTGLSVLIGWLLYDSASTMLAGIRSGAPTVRLDTGDVAMAILLPIILVFAAMSVVVFVRGAEAGAALGKFAVTGAIVALPIALAGPWLFQAWAADALGVRGYVRCDVRSRPSRFPSPTYARSASLCRTATRD